MKLARHRIAKALAERSLSGTADGLTNGLAKEIAAYLMAERRTGDLNSLMRDVMQLRAEQGIVEVVAVTAYPLTPEVVTNIQKTIKEAVPTAKTVIVTERHDDDVVGGVRLEMANEQLDLSIRNKLNRLTQLTTAGKV